MRDRDFLMWVADRLVAHGDTPNVDFISKLVSIAEATPLDHETPNTGHYPAQRISKVEFADGL